MAVRMACSGPLGTISLTHRIWESWYHPPLINENGMTCSVTTCPESVNLELNAVHKVSVGIYSTMYPPDRVSTLLVIFHDL